MPFEYVLITVISLTVFALATLLAGHLTTLRRDPPRFSLFLHALRVRAVPVPLVYRQQEHRHRIQGFPIRHSRAGL